jgi:hypothetical protein
MRPHDAEKLLGGFAAGILTPAEKQLLFSAALDDQELFNALADEEALRELLADPRVRQQLIAQLSGPAAARPLPFWRRPATVGLAASLFALVTTSVVLLHRERPLASPVITPPRSPEPRAAESEFLAKKTLPPEPRREAPAAAPPAAAQLPETLPLADRSEASDLRMRVAAAPETKAERKKEAENQASAVVEVVAAKATTDAATIETRGNFSQETLEQLPAARSTVERTLLAPGVAAGGAVPPRKSADKGITLAPAPTWTLKDRELGRPRLTVAWAAGRHLYVIKRSGAGAALLAPQKPVQAAAGTCRATFEFTASEKDHVDLYLLDHPEPDPASLPETGAVDGFRKRVF